jgi:hypothetical protein
MSWSSGEAPRASANVPGVAVYSSSSASAGRHSQTSNGHGRRRSRSRSRSRDRSRGHRSRSREYRGSDSRPHSDKSSRPSYDDSRDKKKSYHYRRDDSDRRSTAHYRGSNYRGRGRGRGGGGHSSRPAASSSSSSRSVSAADQKIVSGHSGKFPNDLARDEPPDMVGKPLIEVLASLARTEAKSAQQKNDGQPHAPLGTLAMDDGQPPMPVDAPAMDADDRSHRRRSSTPERAVAEKSAVEDEDGALPAEDAAANHPTSEKESDPDEGRVPESAVERSVDASQSAPAVVGSGSAVGDDPRVASRDRLDEEAKRARNRDTSAALKTLSSDVCQIFIPVCSLLDVAGDPINNDFVETRLSKVAVGYDKTDDANHMNNWQPHAVFDEILKLVFDRYAHINVTFVATRLRVDTAVANRKSLADARKWLCAWVRDKFGYEHVDADVFEYALGDEKKDSVARLYKAMWTRGDVFSADCSCSPKLSDPSQRCRFPAFAVVDRANFQSMASVMSPDTKAFFMGLCVPDRKVHERGFEFQVTNGRLHHAV